MDKQMFMSSFQYLQAPSKVDKEKGVIEKVAVVTAGEALGHDVYLDQSFLEKVVEFGNLKKQGLKCRFGHPNMCSTALGTFIGRIKNFSLENNMVKADLFLSNSAKEAPGGDLYTYVLEMAEKESDMFGLSIVFQPGEYYQKKDDGEFINDQSLFDLDKPIYTTCGELFAADIVDDPAANPAGLFSKFNEDTFSAQVTEFLDTHPYIYEQLAKSPAIIEQFMAKYSKYQAAKKEDQIDEKVLTEMFEKEPKEVYSNDIVKEEISKEEEKYLEVAKVSSDSYSVIYEEAIEDFISFAEVEGFEFAKENYNKTDSEILQIKLELIKKENEELKNKLTTLSSTPVRAGAEPLTISIVDDKPKDILQIVEQKKISGLSAAQAWKEVINQFPNEYKKLISKN